MTVKKTARLGLILLLLVAAAVGLYVGYGYFQKTAYPVKYEEYVLRYSEQNGLSPSLVYAVIRTESSFRPEAQSSVGARGLMQITEETFEWIRTKIGDGEQTRYEDLFDEETNIRYGTCLLRLLINEFGSINNALCAYHAGWGNAKKWLANEEYAPGGVFIQNIPFGDTARYVKKVTETREKYQKIYDIQ